MVNLVECADIAGLWPFGAMLPSNSSLLIILGTVLEFLGSIAHGLLLGLEGLRTVVKRCLLTLQERLLIVASMN